MKAVIVQFPGINRERDMARALELAGCEAPVLAWHTDNELPRADLVVLPGGFSHGDYLRCGAIAARAPIMEAVSRHISQGGYALGVCNGFQILLEAGFLPGALMRNDTQTFVCKTVHITVTNTSTFLTSGMDNGAIAPCPVAHGEGRYFADEETLKCLEDNGQVVFRYTRNSNPNGSVDDIAGICSEDARVIGMMPHPENRVEHIHGGDECLALFKSAHKFIGSVS